MSHRIKVNYVWPSCQFRRFGCSLARFFCRRISTKISDKKCQNGHLMGRDGDSGKMRTMSLLSNTSQSFFLGSAFRLNSFSEEFDELDRRNIARLTRDRCLCQFFASLEVVESKFVMKRMIGCISSLSNRGRNSKEPQIRSLKKGSFPQRRQNEGGLNVTHFCHLSFSYMNISLIKVQLLLRPGALHLFNSADI